MFELCRIENGPRVAVFHGNELGQILVTGTDGSRGVVADIRHPDAKITLPGGVGKSVRDFLFEAFENMSPEEINRHWTELTPYYNAIYEKTRR